MVCLIIAKCERSAPKPQGHWVLKRGAADDADLGARDESHVPHAPAKLTFGADALDDRFLVDAQVAQADAVHRCSSSGLREAVASGEAQQHEPWAHAEDLEEAHDAQPVCRRVKERSTTPAARTTMSSTPASCQSMKNTSVVMFCMANFLWRSFCFVKK
jgi:hypothetical protein